MKCISLLQPWASLVVLGHKKIETRSWNTKHRGPLLVHASKKDDGFNRQCFYQWREGFKLDLPKWEVLPFGAIIGQVNLDGVVRTAKMKPFWNTPIGIMNGDKQWRLSTQEKLFGNYNDGRYGWLLSDHVAFDEMIPVAGSLSLWDFDMETKQKVTKPKKQTNLF